MCFGERNSIEYTTHKTYVRNFITLCLFIQKLYNKTKVPVKLRITM